MARKSRIDVVGTVHHVMVRGLDRQVIFRERVDRVAYVQRLEETLAWGQTGCFAWALMANHVHLVLQQGRASLSAVMHRVNSWYAQYFNRRYGRTDSLFGGRPKMKVVDKEEYLKALVRYVHLNPVKAHQVTFEQLEDWAWTGHGALMGKAKPRFLLVDEVLGYFADEAGAAREALSGWMFDGLAPGSSAALIARLEGPGKPGRKKGDVDTRIVGDATFADQIFAQIHDQDARRVRLLAQGWTPVRILEAVAVALEIDPARIRAGERQRTESTCRAITAWLACSELDASATEVGQLTGVSRSCAARARQRGEALADAYGLRRVEDLPTERTRPLAEVASERPGLDVLLLAAATVHGLTPADLRNPARGRLASAARKLFCWVAIREFGHRGSDVGPYIARHPSVANRYSKADVDPQMLAKLLALLPDRPD